MVKKCVIYTCFFVLLSLGTAQGDTLYVPDDFTSIQDAINGCASGDILIVKSGTYLENINFFGKALHLKSEFGPETTVIDGSAMGSVVTFGYAEGPDSIIEGFTITNGKFAFGGGIFCNFSSPTVRDCIVVGNEADNSGGGISCWNYSNTTVSNTLIADNHATGPLAQGGGVAFWGDCGAVFTNVTICGNSAVRSGGGIDSYNSYPTVTNTIIWDNSAPLGEQIYVDSGDPLITWCDIQGGFDGHKNIDADPLFADAPNLDFHIGTDSPCFNAGWNRAMALPEYDLEGNYRIQNGFCEMGVYETSLESLWSDVSTLPASTGGTVTFDVDATVEHANRMYFLVGSLSGDFPGVMLPTGIGCILPLNRDNFFNMITHQYNGPNFIEFRGYLDANGQAVPVMDTGNPISPGLIGETMSFAYATEYPNNFASSVISVEITP